MSNATLELRELIRHMRVHDGYLDNGYWQMTTPQKALYRRVTKTTHKTHQEHYRLYRTSKGLNP